MAGTSDHELAAEMLDVVNPAELTDFVRRRLVGGHGGPGGARLVDDLIATAVGTIPLLGTLGGRRTDPLVTQARAARAYDVELEGLSHEDQNYLIAQQFVRYARHAVAAADRSAVPQALAAAAHAHAPGLVARPGGSPPGAMSHPNVIPTSTRKAHHV